MNAFDGINTYKDKAGTVVLGITEEEAEIIRKLIEKNSPIDYAKFILKRRDSIAAK